MFVVLGLLCCKVVLRSYAWSLLDLLLVDGDENCAADVAQEKDAASCSAEPDLAEENASDDQIEQIDEYESKHAAGADVESTKVHRHRA